MNSKNVLIKNVPDNLKLNIRRVPKDIYELK
jgi:hypothetical protein